MLQVTVLGCGPSLGTPIIGCKCRVCTSKSPYNKRTRSSILISNQTTRVLVDFGFDIKDQLLGSNVSSLDAAILTHDHADHVGGIDNLRVFSFIHGRPLDVYVNKDIFAEIHDRYNYLFKAGRLTLKPIGVYDDIVVGSMKIQLFNQHHGEIDSLGLRVEDFVLSCDVVNFPKESEQYLRHIDVWLLDCLDYNSNNCHAGLDKVLLWDEEFRPKKIYLTNMNHAIDYHEITERLPSHIRPSYDGLKIKIS